MSQNIKRRQQVQIIKETTNTVNKKHAVQVRRMVVTDQISLNPETKLLNERSIIQNAVTIDVCKVSMHNE
jgi:hypothetical protein